MMVPFIVNTEFDIWIVRPSPCRDDTGKLLCFPVTDFAPYLISFRAGADVVDQSFAFHGEPSMGKSMHAVESIAVDHGNFLRLGGSAIYLSKSLQLHSTPLPDESHDGNCLALFDLCPTRDDGRPGATSAG
jgi:hypothetical protein